MTRAAHLVAVPDLPLDEVRSDHRLDLVFGRLQAGWRAAQWDASLLLLRVDPSDRQASQTICRVSGCEKTARSNHGLCAVCRRRFVANGSDDLEAWLSTSARTARQRGVYGPDDLQCEVAQDGKHCARSAINPEIRLCALHDTSWRAFRRRGGTDRAQWIATAVPAARTPDCLVSGCRLQSETRRLCRSHYRRWCALGENEDIESWAAREEPLRDGLTLWLGGLPTLIANEILYVLQKRDAEGHRFDLEPVRAIARAARQRAAESLIDIAGPFHGSAQRWLNYAHDTFTILYADPDAEKRKDVWDLRVLNLAAGRETGTKPLIVDFTPIRQRWLRNMAKRWIETGSVNRADNVRLSIAAIGYLSDSIALGNAASNRTRLSRSDIDRFMKTIASLVGTEGMALTNKSKSRYVTAAKSFLAHARGDGWLDEVPGAFAFRADDGFDLRAISDDDDLVGRAVPEHVIAQLNDYVDLLDRGRDIRPLGLALIGRLRRLAYALLRDTGRRVSDLAELRLDCARKQDDGWYLIYTNVKARRRGQRLPTDESTAREITEVATLISSTFPHTSHKELWLFPRLHKNFDGKFRMTAAGLSDWIDRWLADIPEEVILNDYADAGGVVRPFDRELIYPHAFRHAYAQRHADAGTPVDVLCELMDHRSVETTMIYYVVTQERRRAAVEQVAPMRVDRNGNRVGGTSVLAYESQSVAVPYGNCKEPSNVAAGGKSCPLRFQCSGCSHYRPDPSFLPAIEAHTHELLQNRETALATGAADWVVDGLEKEIAAYRNIAANMRADLAGLDESDRAAIEEASSILRRARAAETQGSPGPILVQIAPRRPEETQ